jgi:hypothetical protein
MDVNVIVVMMSPEASLLLCFIRRLLCSHEIDIPSLEPSKLQLSLLIIAQHLHGQLPSRYFVIVSHQNDILPLHECKYSIQSHARHMRLLMTNCYETNTRTLEWCSHGF